MMGKYITVPFSVILPFRTKDSYFGFMFHKYKGECLHHSWAYYWDISTDNILGIALLKPSVHHRFP